MLDNLYAPYELHGKKIKNRYVVAPMVTNYCTRDGKATEKFIAYHEEKAKGGWGIIITEDYAVDPKGRGFSCVAGLWEDEQIASHSELPKRVHQHDAVLIAQIYHCGRQTYENRINSRPYAPSPIHCPFSPEDIPIELSVPEIEKIVQQFGDTALRAKKCGFDGIEIHGAHGYLVSEFMSPYANKRTDSYGGNIQNRMKFPISIVHNIREKCGKDFIIIFRISVDEFIEGGRTLEDTKIIAALLENAGVDMIHVTAGVYGSTDAMVAPVYVKHAWLADYAKEIKAACSIPVIVVGRINDPLIADSVIKAGKADFVAMARASLADPALPDKAKDGKFDDIRYCIACSKGCLGQLFLDKQIKCVLNPLLGMEYQAQPQKAAKAKKVAIIGAGPAGLQAALAAASIGHKVDVYEKTAYAGGQFRAAAIPPGKGELATFIIWQTAQLEKLGVKIHYNTEISANSFQPGQVDEIIIATGASPVLPQIPGADLPHVVMAEDLLYGKVSVGKNVVVVGGGQVGTETAHHLAVQLKDVTIIEKLPEIAGAEDLATRWHLLRFLEQRKVKILTNTEVSEICATGLVAKQCNESITVAADTVVIAVGAKSNDLLAASFAQAGFSVHTIGDAQKVAQVLEATSQGHELGISL